MSFSQSFSNVLQDISARRPITILIGVLALSISGYAATIDTAIQSQSFPTTLTDFSIPLTFNKFVSPDSSAFPYLTSITVTIAETVSGQVTISNLASSGTPNDYLEILSIVTTVTGPNNTSLFSSGGGGFSVPISIDQVGPGESKTASNTASVAPITQVLNGPDTTIFDGLGDFVITFTGTGLSDTIGKTPLAVTNASTSAFGTVSIYATYASVPEPASQALLGIGILGLGILARRRFRVAHS